MAYHDLSECTLTPDERREEGLRIAQMLDRESSHFEMREREREFVDMILCGCPVSVKQLFWLRDLKALYIE